MPTLEAMRAELDSDTTPPTPAQLPGERCQGVTLAREIGEVCVQHALRVGRERLLLRSDLAHERGAMLKR